MSRWGIDERRVSDATLRARARSEQEMALCSTCGAAMFWGDDGVTGCPCLDSAIDRLRERAAKRAAEVLAFKCERGLGGTASREE